MNNTETTPKSCRRIEPVIVYDASGHRIEQSCGNCGRDLEAMPRGWRHINREVVR